MRRPVLLAALLLLLAAPPAGAGGDWPFGAGTGPMATGRDLWNLGLLGAKASDAARAEPTPPLPGPAGGRVVGDGPGGGGEPSTLRVELLLPDGPAARAGLAVGDVIVGVGRHAFGEAGALDALADALLKAEAGRDHGDLALLVRRGGTGDEEKVGVAIPPGGKVAGKPLQGEGRQRILDAALAWLADRQAATGGFPETLSGSNGAVVLASLAGLAWLAGGSDLEHGPWRGNLRRAADFVVRTVGEDDVPAGRGRPSGMDQTNWGHAHAAIFLGELCLRTPTDALREALFASARALEARQEPSGGWAHGPGGPNPLGYTELNIVTGLALTGIGMAARCGFAPSEDVLAKAEAYLEASSSGDGGVGYSTEPGQRGMGNIGRTAAAWLAARLLGRDGTPFGRKMGKYVERHVTEVLDGHASLMQHVLLAGVAAAAAGRSTARAFLASRERDLVLARVPDGSLQPRPWSESQAMGSSSDVMFGEVWTTAAWAIVLGCEPEGERPGLPGWLGREGGSR